MEQTAAAALPQRTENKMSSVPITKLLWKMGLPMIASMILQAVYNIVDTVFVSNIKGELGEGIGKTVGEAGTLALGYAFPVQVFMIAVGVGTGIGINALISKSLGEGDNKRASKVVGNGLFLALCWYVVFLLIGIFAARPFITMMAGGATDDAYLSYVIDMGATYLQICCIVSFGTIGYSIAERFLQATGRTNLSTIAQITGAASNIVLDYVFIFVFGWGVAGAAWATVAGQILSLVLALVLHYTKNKELDKRLRYVKPDFGIIKAIYKIGISAIVIQALPTVMMMSVNAVLGLYSGSGTLDADTLQNAYSIYNKIFQFPLFALFGLSNTIITVFSFNHGMGDKERCKQTIKWGILDSLIVAGIMIVIFETLANPLAKLFGIASGEGSGTEVQKLIARGMHIAAAGYLFMAFSVAVQGVIQAFQYAVRPAILVACRQIILLIPFVYLFVVLPNTEVYVWLSFVIAEFLTAFIAFGMLFMAYKRKIAPMPAARKVAGGNLIVTVSREHGSNGRYVGFLVAKKLGIGYYDKELAAKVAKERGLVSRTESALSGEEYIRNMYLTTATDREAVIAQAETIREIADTESCVIVGRAADFILKDYENVVKVFIYADPDFRIETVKEAYGDDDASARRQIERANGARRAYYEFISGMNWGDMSHYDLCINSSIGAEQTAELIVRYIAEHKTSVGETADGWQEVAEQTAEA